MSVSWKVTALRYAVTLQVCTHFKEEKNILHAVKRREAASLTHILHRNCLLKHITAVKIQGEGRRVRGHKQLLDDVKEMKRQSKLKEEALYRTVWRTGFGGGCGRVVRGIV